MEQRKVRVFSFDPGFQPWQLVKAIRAALEDEGMTLSSVGQGARLPVIRQDGRDVVPVPVYRIVAL